MWDWLGQLLNFSGPAVTGVPFGGGTLGDSGANFAGMLAQVLEDPAARAAFLDRAAMGADPRILTGALSGTGTLGLSIPQSMTPPQQAAGGMVPAGPMANPWGQSGAATPPLVPPGETPTRWDAMPVPPTPGQLDPSLAYPNPERERVSLGKLLREASGGAGSNKQQPPERMPVVPGAGASHGSVNRVAAPNYLPLSVGDQQAAHRRATLAALLGGR